MKAHPTFNRFNGHKLLRFSDRLEQIAEGGEPYPVDWHVFPSNVCNHACSFCMYIQNGEQKDFHVKLSRPILLKAVEDAARTGAKLMHFSGGGEPLLNRHTPEAMELARSKGLKTAMSTNGSRLTAEIIQHVNYLRVSLNAGTPGQHHKTNHAGEPRHPGDFNQILDNLRECVPAARKMRDEKEHHDIGLAFVIDAGNWRDIYPFVSAAAAVGADFVHIRPGFYYDAEADLATRDIMPAALEQCRKAERDFGAILDIHALTDKFDGYWTPRTYHRCLAVWTGTTLRATGDFAVCQDRTDLVWGNSPKYSLGASFEDCWHSEERRAVVARIHDGEGGELTACPRCVWNGRNNMIEEAFVKDGMRLDLI